MKYVLKSTLTNVKTETASRESGMLPGIFLGRGYPFCVTAYSPDSAKLETSLATARLSLTALKDTLPFSLKKLTSSGEKERFRTKYDFKYSEE